MKVRALKPFTMRDETTGELTSVACKQIIDVDTEVANQLISDGLADRYTLISPTGSVTLTENGETNDVTPYANAIVNVPNSSTGEIEITENGTYDVTAKASAVVNVAGDFSVANVSVVVGQGAVGTLIVSQAVDKAGETSTSYGDVSFNEAGTYTLSVIMYKGHANCWLDLEGSIATVSGSMDLKQGVIIDIYGSGTIELTHIT